MADYGADPGGYKSGGWGTGANQLTVYSPTLLEARIKELEAEVRKLKGYKKFKVTVQTLTTKEIEVEALDRADAVNKVETGKHESILGAVEVDEDEW